MWYTPIALVSASSTVNVLKLIVIFSRYLYLSIEFFASVISEYTVLEHSGHLDGFLHGYVEISVLR